MVTKFDEFMQNMTVDSLSSFFADLSDGTKCFYCVYKSGWACLKPPTEYTCFNGIKQYFESEVTKHD